MRDDEIQKRVRDVSDLMKEKLGARGKGLAKQVRRRGGLLSRSSRSDARYLDEAAAMSAHPKLARQIDENRIKKAHRSLLHKLEQVDDPGKRRMDVILSTAGTIAFGMLVMCGLIITVMRLEGLI